jgi:hypothetical protein
VAGGRNDGEVRVGEVGQEVAAEHAGRLDLVVFSGDHEYSDVDLLGLAGDLCPAGGLVASDIFVPPSCGSIKL